MAKAVKPIPDGYHSLANNIVVKGADRAIEFYKKAFGAVETYRLMAPDGKSIMHAEIKIGDSPLMLMDEIEGMDSKSPQTLGGSPVGFYCYVNDVDQSYKRAVEAGGKEQMGLEDMFWGDRCGSVTDPFGYHWTLATHVEDVSPEEIEKRAKEFFAKKAA